MILQNKKVLLTILNNIMLREVDGEWAVFLNGQLYKINRLSSAFNYRVILMTTVRGHVTNARTDQVIYMREYEAT